MTQMYVVEHRASAPPGEHYGPRTLARLSSSMEKAREFIRDNANYDDRSRRWLWAVWKEEVDTDDLGDADELTFFDWDGNEILGGIP